MPDPTAPDLVRETSGAAFDTVVVDVDGTLVDSVYEHAVAWGRAFHDVGLSVPSSAVHAAIGMGSEQLVAHVAGERAEHAMGDRIRQIHAAEFEHLGARIRLLPGADQLIGELKHRGLRVVIASSGSERDTARALDHVPDAALADAVVTGQDVRKGKPETDLIDTALTVVRGERAAVIGDSPWDAIAGRAGGHYVIAVRSGGFSDASLTSAGAQLVYEDVADVVTHLDDTPLSGASSARSSMWSSGRA
jgi:HAD superfamily hydrolase (TIGR01549 family)